jgi:formylglycine-generating enzyme required for sulfatase activity
MKLHLHFPHKSGLLVVLGLLLFSQAIHAQDRDIYGNKVSSELCDQMEFDTDEEVQRLVTKLLEAYNLPNRYIIGPCSRVSNCVATRDERGRPYILYNPAFLDKIKVFAFTETDLPTAAEDWAVLLVLAHEIGHHLNNHIINPHPDLTKRDMELEADETAGYLLYLLNAPDLKTAQKGLQVPQVSEAGSYTHPPRSERLAAFRKGWDKAAKKFPRSETSESDDDDTFIEVEEDIYTDPVLGKFILVEGGVFNMGCTTEQGNNCCSDEKPVRRVSLDDYYICETEVTQAQWKAVMGSNPSFFKNCDNCPVETVRWTDVQTFISRLNDNDMDVSYRLPTEAEWEYAARGGSLSKRYKYAGSNNISEVAWYKDNSGNKTHPVKGKTANELGIYDMSGNVWEWCSDWKGDYAIEKLTNPIGSKDGPGRVDRGGGWSFVASGCRVSNRYANEPGHRSSSLGFRLAISVIK